MAVGQPYRSHSMDDLSDKDTCKSNWKTNFFFLFSSSSHVFLWPWVPLILRLSGLTKREAGIATSLVIMASTGSVFFALHFLNKTRSGSMRRLFLFTSSVISVFFSVSAILTIPTSRDNLFCPLTENNNWYLNETTQSILPNKTHLNNQTINTSPPSDNEITSTVNNNALKNTTTVVHANIKHTSSPSKHLYQALSTPSSNNKKIQSTTARPVHNNTEHVPINDTLKNISRMNSNSFDLENNDKSVINVSIPSTLPPSIFLTHSKNTFSNITQIPKTYELKSPYFGDYYSEDKYYYEKEENEPFENSQLESNDEFFFFNNNAGSPNSPIDAATTPRISHSILTEDKNSAKDSENRKQTNFSPSNSYIPGQFQNLSSNLDRFFRSSRTRRNTNINENNVKTNAQESTGSKGWGIATLLMIAAILGGGIEASIYKVWHCYNYGVAQEKGHMDILEAAIVPTFRLCTLGEHQRWSLVSASLLVIIPSVLAELACHFETIIYTPFTIYGVFHLLCGMISWVGILFVPIPYGNLGDAMSKYPLSLYLDDEVLREGLRRVGFHSWTFFTGILISLPSLYFLWLCEEMSTNRQEAFAIQTLAIVVLYFGEGVLYLVERGISRKMNEGTMMMASGALIAMQNIICWSSVSIKFKGGSLLLVGYSNAFMWIAARNNALLLGNTNDQEKEAWISWISCKAGLVLGAILWACLSDSEWSDHQVQNLMAPSAIVATTIVVIILFISIIMRSKGQRRRSRIYHTLDLNLINDDEEEEMTTPTEEMEEKDWLVKRARKEGITL